MEGLPARASPPNPPSFPQPFLSSATPRQPFRKTEQRESSIFPPRRGLADENNGAQSNQSSRKPAYALGYASSEHDEERTASHSKPRYLEARPLAPVTISAPALLTPLPQLWKLPIEAFKDLAILLKIKVRPKVLSQVSVEYRTTWPLLVLCPFLHEARHSCGVCSICS